MIKKYIKEIDDKTFELKTTEDKIIKVQLEYCIDLKTVSTKSRHSNTNTTLAVYTFQIESNKRLSADLFDNLINS